jgi:hypothetical protein
LLIYQSSIEDLQHKKLGNQTHKLEQEITDRSSDEITKIIDALQLLELDRVKFTGQVNNPEENIYYFSMDPPSNEQTIQYSKEIKKARQDGQNNFLWRKSREHCSVIECA